MPTLDWLNRDAAFRSVDQVPYRLLQAVTWVRTSAGKGVFLMVERLVNGQDLAAQLRHALMVSG